jgi:hypothetical protein
MDQLTILQAQLDYINKYIAEHEVVKQSTLDKKAELEAKIALLQE